MSINITSIVLREIKMSLVEPFQTSSGEVNHKRILLAELKTENDSAWGECVAKQIPNYSPETIDTCWLMIEKFLAPKLLNNPFEHPNDIFDRLQENIRGNLMAKACLEMACWSLAAQQKNMSLSAFIGGTRDAVKTGVSLGIQKTPDILIQKVKEAVDAGYQKVKIKIKPGFDFEYITKVREAFPNIELMVDANNAYKPEDDLTAFDNYDLMMVEQPLAWDDIYHHRALQKKLKTPVCLDESITSIEKAEEMIGLEAGKIINIKPGRVGGFGPSIAIHDLCQKHDIPVWCGGMLETGIGRAYNIALASLPNFTMPGDLSPSARYWKKDIVDPEWTMSDNGYVSVRKETGLGVTINTDMIEELTVNKTVLT